MRYKPKTSPVIRATLAAMEAIDRLRDARMEAATDDAEQERVQAEYWDVMRPLMTTLHEAQFGPPTPIPNGPRLVTRDPSPKKPRTATPTTRTDTNPVYQLMITLRDSTPPIWRRVQVRGNTSLSRLHAILQIAMGWTDSHLHEFVVHDVHYGFPDMEWDPLARPKDERRVRLGQLVTREQDRFSYEYDFGDGWAHNIVVEQILPPEPGVPYPRCIAGKCACPPEDVGGMSGYEAFITAIQDPTHAEHAELLAWAGGAFDPEAFDLTALDRALRGLPR
jgi:Plasmid pRiA4b ORF-3-like protein